MRLSGRSDRVVVSIEHSRGSRWLSLDDGSVTLRMVAEASASNADEIACRVFLLGDGTPNGGLLVFEAQVQLAASYPPAPAAQRLVNGLQLPQIHQPGQLYAHGMFHGPRLPGCTRIAQLGRASGREKGGPYG